MDGDELVGGVDASGAAGVGEPVDAGVSEADFVDPGVEAAVVADGSEDSPEAARAAEAGEGAEGGGRAGRLHVVAEGRRDDERADEGGATGDIRVSRPLGAFGGRPRR